MSHRTDIRAAFTALLTAATAATVEQSRAHEVSTFPLVRVNNGLENRIVTDATRNGTPTEFELVVKVWTSGSDADTQSDTIIDAVDLVVSTNRSTSNWSSARVQGITNPEDEHGEDELVTMCEISIIFKTEV